MIGPSTELKEAILAAIPKNENDPKFYEKLCVVNEVLLELILLMQKHYKEEIAKLKLDRDDAIAAANIRAKEHRDARDRAAGFEQDLWNCRAARDAYSTQVDAYRKWEQRISKG